MEAKNIHFLDYEDQKLDYNVFEHFLFAFDEIKREQNTLLSNKRYDHPLPKILKYYYGRFMHGMCKHVV